MVEDSEFEFESVTILFWSTFIALGTVMLLEICSIEAVCVFSERANTFSMSETESDPSSSPTDARENGATLVAARSAGSNKRETTLILTVYVYELDIEISVC